MDPSIDESRDNAEEFETVDSIPEQDEEVTTTSFSGETVEADRYEPGYSSPAKTAGTENTQNLLDFDNEQLGQISPSEFVPISSNSEPLKPSAPPAFSGLDLLGETYENNPTTSSSEKTTPVKAPERKEAVSAPAGNGSTTSVGVLHLGSI